MLSMCQRPRCRLHQLRVNQYRQIRSTAAVACQRFFARSLPPSPAPQGFRVCFYKICINRERRRVYRTRPALPSLIYSRSSLLGSTRAAFRVHGSFSPERRAARAKVKGGLTSRLVSIFQTRGKLGSARARETRGATTRSGLETRKRELRGGTPRSSPQVRSGAYCVGAHLLCHTLPSAGRALITCGSHRSKKEPYLAASLRTQRRVRQLPELLAGG